MLKQKLRKPKKALKATPLKSEIWKDIPGFEGMYQASTFGRIRSLDRSILVEKRGKLFPVKLKGRLLNFAKKINGAGYYNCYLGLYVSRDVHRLVAETFLIRPSDKHQVNHKNCNKLDNSVENLEWVTPFQNIQHMLKNGRLEQHRKSMSIKNSGEGNPKAKLTIEVVKRIKRAFIAGYPTEFIGKMFGVTGSTIRHIRTNKTWRSVNV